MDNNQLSNHIYTNTHRHFDRVMQARVKGERGNIENNFGGAEIFVVNMPRATERNGNFREAIWTGKYLQGTLMSIGRGEDIGVELHSDTDQYIRIERGDAIALVGEKEDCLSRRYELHRGDAIFIPAGVWHNILNAGRCNLKISSIYAPPHHPKGAVEPNKK